MDPISFSVGVVGLVSTFTTCVDCFDYIRIGRNLGEDYQTAIVKLDLVRLRFTRWGQAAGIVHGGQNVDEGIAVAQLRSKLTAPDKEFPTIMQTLGQILRLFERTVETSERLALKSTKVQAPVSDDVGFEDTTLQALHEKMRNFAIRRQSRSTLLQKTRWALYRKRDFTGLIEDLTELVTALVELVPAEPQQQLCKEEVAEINSDQSLVVLDDVLRAPVGEDKAPLDNFLYETVVKTIEGRKGTMTTTAWKRSKAGDGSRIQQGDCIERDYQGEVRDGARDYLVEDSEFGKGVVFHQGDSYGGRNH
jgi:hypothetical protein